MFPDRWRPRECLGMSGDVARSEESRESSTSFLHESSNLLHRLAYVLTSSSTSRDNHRGTAGQMMPLIASSYAVLLM